MSDVINDEKLQKVLARAGFGSRREMETWISEGRITVNGKTATLGDRVKADDAITVDGKKVANTAANQEMTRVLLYNKPEQEICSRNDPEGRVSVFDHLPPIKHGRWVAVGRLDFNTSGLLLFTTDGELANRLMHPSSGIDREYAVRINGDVSDEMVEAVKRGVDLDGDGHLCRFTDVQYYAGEGRNRWYHVVIMEGRNREVRRLWESQGVRVSRLKRVRYGPVFIPSRVKQGQFYEMKVPEVIGLYETVNLPPPSGTTRRPSRDRKRRR